jgi:hypothetical protein
VLDPGVSGTSQFSNGLVKAVGGLVKSLGGRLPTQGTYQMAQRMAKNLSFQGALERSTGSDQCGVLVVEPREEISFHWASQSAVPISRPRGEDIVKRRLVPNFGQRRNPRFNSSRRCYRLAAQLTVSKACYRAYEQHCREMHGADTESHIHFDLQKLMLSLKK